MTRDSLGIDRLVFSMWRIGILGRTLDMSIARAMRKRGVIIPLPNIEVRYLPATSPPRSETTFAKSLPLGSGMPCFRSRLLIVDLEGFP